MKLLRGREIQAWAAAAEGLQERGAAPSGMHVLHEPPEGRAGVLVGLRRTGRTALLRQAAPRLSAGELERAAVPFVEDGGSAGWAEKAFDALKNERSRHVDRAGRETFKAFFKKGEDGMAVRDAAARACGIHEDKRGQCIDADACAVHLPGAEKAAPFGAAGGRTASRAVLCRGSREMEAGGVRRRNGGRFLKKASHGSLDPAAGQANAG